MINMSPTPIINMNNVYSNKEQNFMSDYEILSIGAVSRQSPTEVSKYQNINETRRKYLENIVRKI